MQSLNIVTSIISPSKETIHPFHQVTRNNLSHSQSCIMPQVSYLTKKKCVA